MPTITPCRIKIEKTNWFLKWMQFYDWKRLIPSNWKMSIAFITNSTKFNFPKIFNYSLFLADLSFSINSLLKSMTWIDSLIKIFFIVAVDLIAFASGCQSNDWKNCDTGQQIAAVTCKPKKSLNQNFYSKSRAIYHKRTSLRTWPWMENALSEKKGVNWSN